jgi:hypothetical protein
MEIECLRDFAETRDIAPAICSQKQIGKIMPPRLHEAFQDRFNSISP